MKPITASWGMVDEYPISSSIAVFWSYKNHENHMGLPGALIATRNKPPFPVLLPRITSLERMVLPL